ncbi:MAG: hypothetical protein AAF413_04030 [Patescibacteria group bacterium]
MTGIFAAGSDLEGTLTGIGLRTVGIAAIVLVVLLIIAANTKDRYPKSKLPLFSLITGVITLSTLYLFVSTIYLNVVSDTGGPIHWHAEIEYWACDAELEVKDPYKFASNKIGSPVLHEHNDKWIHHEGVVVSIKDDATIGHFMETIGGSLSATRFTLPVNDDQLIENDTDGDQTSDEHVAELQTRVRKTDQDISIIEIDNSQGCGEENAEVQVYVYQFNKDNDTYKQIKLEPGIELVQRTKDDPNALTELESAAAYIYADESQLPPGDCIIVEYGPRRAFTDKLCSQYGLKDVDRCVEFGVSEFNEKLCNIRDVTDYESANVEQSQEQAETIATGQSLDGSEASEYCPAYYGPDGTRLDADIQIVKADGSLVVPEVDCRDYLDSLQGEADE